MEMYVAHTFEIDDAESAVEEILESLPLDSIQSKNAVGIINTHVDAISSGVIDALADALPFDFIGMTAFATCANGESSVNMLTLTVLVSEKNTFTTLITEPLGADCENTIKKAYNEATKNLEQKPSLNIVCAPLVPGISGQEITSFVTNISDNVPLFGAFSLTHTMEPGSSYTFLNNNYHTEILALICISGPVNASFKLASLGPDNKLNKKCTITDAEGNIVCSINDAPVISYINQLGLEGETIKKSGAMLPFLVDYRDGRPLLVREPIEITQDKCLRFGGEMPVGGDLYLASQTPESIVNSSKLLLEEIEADKENVTGVLVVGCAGRSFVLGSDMLREAEDAIQILDESIPYHQNYARGEICPITLSNGQLQNEYHNFSFTICIFKKA